jgi:hypothetical protein
MFVPCLSSISALLPWVAFAVVPPTALSSSPVSAEAPAPASTPADATPGATGSSSAGEPAVESTLSRASFDAILSGGPQRVVAAVDVQPALVGGRFVGFRIVRFRPDGVLRDCTSILPGDVIVRVNREPVERPEQFMRAWDVVKSASALEVEILRQGRAMRLRWTLAP